MFRVVVVVVGVLGLEINIATGLMNLDKEKPQAPFLHSYLWVFIVNVIVVSSAKPEGWFYNVQSLISLSITDTVTPDGNSNHMQIYGTSYITN